MSIDEIMEQARQVANGTEPTADVDAPKSPARKEATGNIRNLKQMGDGKFFALWEEMTEYIDRDPKAYAACEVERERRLGNG